MVIDERRQQPQEWDNWLLPKEVARIGGLSAGAKLVFALIFTRVNGENEAWPGQDHIAQSLDLGERSVRRHCRELERHGIIEVERQGLRKTNRYRLTGEYFASRSAISREAKLAGQERPNWPVKSGQIGRSHSKENQCKENQCNTSAAEPAAVPSKTINDLIELFRTVNPSVDRLFANKSQRGAVERLCVRLGEEELRRIVGVLPALVSERYAPVVTTPTQLEAKLGQLAAFMKKRVQNPNLVVV